MLRRRAYGNGALADALFEANRDQFSSSDRIYAGQELVLPLAGKKKNSKTYS